MVKIRFIAVAAAIAILSGCTAKVYSPIIEANKNIPAVTVEKPVSKEPIKPPEETKKEEPVKPKEAAEPQKPALTNPKQPEGKTTKGEKLNFEALDKLNNTKQGWGMGLHGKDVIPPISSQTKKLLEKYDSIYIGDTSKKVVYLTFDEGYENGYTPKILDTLKANNVKAVFFVTGPYIKEHLNLVQRMLNEGHLIGNHSINHPSMPTLSNSAIENEIYGLEKQFTAAVGKGMKYFRPPMGEYSERTLAAAQQLGYKTVFWSFAYLDYDTKNQKGADYAYKTVMNNLHNGSVLLLHAVSKDNTEALDRIIKDIKAQGYEIRLLDL